MGRDVFREPWHSSALRETWRAELAVYRTCLVCGRFGVASDLGLVDSWFEAAPEWLDEALEAWGDRLAAEDCCVDVAQAAYYRAAHEHQTAGA
jgi:hypothetical protein